MDLWIQLVRAFRERATLYSSRDVHQHVETKGPQRIHPAISLAMTSTNQNNPINQTR